MSWVPYFRADVEVDNQNLVVSDESGQGFGYLAAAMVEEADFSAADVAVESQFPIVDGTNGGLTVRMTSGAQCYSADVSASTANTPLFTGIYL